MNFAAQKKINILVFREKYYFKKYARAHKVVYLYKKTFSNLSFSVLYVFPFLVFSKLFEQKRKFLNDYLNYMEESWQKGKSISKEITKIIKAEKVSDRKFDSLYGKMCELEDDLIAYVKSNCSKFFLAIWFDVMVVLSFVATFFLLVWFFASFGR